MGDEVQAIKAGILETADVFAVNKADRDGADATMRDLELMIALGSEAMVAVGQARGHVVHGGVKVDVIPGAAAARRSTGRRRSASASRRAGEGIAELVDALERHSAWLDGTEAGRARRRAAPRRGGPRVAARDADRSGHARARRRDRPRRRRRRGQDDRPLHRDRTAPRAFRAR